MQEAQNTKVVQDAYAAFSRGDITALLGQMTDDIQWRVIAYWSKVDAQLGASVAAGLRKRDGASANGAQAAAQELVASRANRA